MTWLREKLSLAKVLIKSLKIEPFVFFLLLASNMVELTRSQLIQDKICLNNYNKSRGFCINLQSSSSDQTVSRVLADSANYQTYVTIISTLPCFVYMLFVGAWTDRYIHGRKIVLCISMVGFVVCYCLQILNAIYFDWSVNYFLVTFIPLTLVGGQTCALMTAYSYMVNTTPKQYLFIKFATFELVSFVAWPIGVYIGGHLLGTGNYESGTLHNYNTVFMVCSGCHVVAFLWVLIVIREKIHTRESVDSSIKLDKSQEMTASPAVTDRFCWSDLLDVSNVKDIVRTAAKSRPNRGRLQLWLLIACMCTFTLSDAKFMTILFPYAEKVYEWDASKLSDVRSLFMIIQIPVMFVAPLLLSTYLKLPDSAVGIIGFTSVYMSDVGIGTIISPLGLYLLYSVGSVAGISAIAVRSLMAAIVPESEIGKIYALSGSLEQLFPSVQAVIYNTIFASTLDWYPSLAFQLAAALNLFPILALVWIDLSRQSSQKCIN